MKGDDSQEENDLLFRILLESEERGEIAGSSNTKDLPAAAARQLVALKNALESIRIASSGDSTPVDGFGEIQNSEGAVVFPYDLCLSNRFEIIRRLGSGGFGVVVLARDKQLQCNVALKVPRPDVLMTKPLVKRFLREAQNVARLSHPNIVPLLGTDDSSDTPTIVYYYCEGPTLAQWIAGQTKPIPAQIAARIGVLLAEGVQHAHSRGVLHRDLKPSNVLLEQSSAGDVLHGFRDGDTVWIPRITDFGISKVLEETDGQTQAGTVMGTLEYMPPEQISGRTNNIGTHSDIYSLGVILYELLAGKVPFSRIELSIGGHQLIEQSSPPSVRKVRPNVPRDLDAILQKCMCASEKGRYTTAADLVRELQNFLTNRPVLARSIGRLSRVQKWMRRQPLAASLAVACIAIVALGLTSMIVNNQRTRSINEQLGTTNENLANAVIDANRERDLAKQSARELRLLAYCDDLSSADRALREGDISRCDFLLRRQMELSYGDDLRDAAWHYLWQKGHRPFTRIRVSNAPLYSIRFSSDGLRTAICGADGWVRILDTTSTSAIMEWNAEQSELNCATFSLDDQYLATAGDDGSICVWDLRTRKCLNRFRAHPEQAFNAVFASEDKMFTCGNEPTIRAWNWRTGKVLGVLEQHTRGVQSIMLSSDRAMLYSASDDQSWCAWDVKTLSLVSQSEFSGARNVDVQPSPTGKQVFSADSDGIVRRESTEGDGRAVDIIANLPDSVSSISVSSNGQRLAIASREGSVRIVDLNDEGKPMNPSDKGSSNIWASQNSRIHDLAFSPDDAHLHSVDNDGMWTAWKASIETTSWSLNVKSLFPDFERFSISMDQVTRDACIFSSNLKVFSWDTITNRVATLADIDSPVSRLIAYEPSSLVLTGHLTGQVRAWHFSDGQLQPLWEYQASIPSSDISELSYSAARDQIAVTTQSTGSTVRILNAKNGREVRTLKTPNIDNGENGIMVFSSDGQWLACTVESEIIIWNLHSGESRRFTGHDNTVSALCFHPNNEMLVSGGQDRSIRLWNIHTGESIAELRHHKEMVNSVLLSSGGDLLASSDSAGRTSLWHMTAKKFLFELDPLDGEAALAENWIGPKLFSKDRTSIRAEIIGAK